MALLEPQLIYPSYTQPGNTSQRASAVFFMPSSLFAAILPLPKTLTPSQTITTDPILVVGFNTFIAFLDTLTNNIAFKFNVLDPTTQALIVTRTVVTTTAGAGFAGGVGPFGFGNPAAAGGNDVFHTISLSFTNTSGAGNAVLNQFPGLWGCAR